MSASAPTFEVAVLRAVDDRGNAKFYTGRAGQDWLSADVREAFRGYSLEGARRKAMTFNAGMALHGWRFVAVLDL